MNQTSNTNNSTVQIHKGRRYGKILIFISLPLLVIGAGWIISRTLVKSVPRVSSLQDNWETQEATAHRWKNDSFLITARFDVNNSKTYQMSSIYYSPSAKTNLSITIEDSGKVTVIPQSGKSETRRYREERPILRESWKFDSQEALNIFSKIETVKTCLLSVTDSLEQPIYMDLIMSRKDYALWKLDIQNCPKSKDFCIKSFYINAQTGEITNPYYP